MLLFQECCTHTVKLFLIIVLSSSQHFPKLLEKTCGEVKCYTLSLGLIVSISLARGWVNTFQQFCRKGVE